MTTIQTAHIGNRYLIGASGHAKYEAIGKDIVCAAISSLLQSFLLYCEELFEQEKCVIEESKIKDGFILIIVEGEAKYLEAAFKMLLVGLNDLAESYPKYIKMEK